MKRVISLLVVLALLPALLLPAAAAGEEPAPWAQAAVEFCVENGLMSVGDLRPYDNATRAELASMVVRLLDVEQEGADLSSYTDVQSTAWYYPELAKAVAIGVFEGDGKQLQPLKTLTREQAMTVLARCYGVPAGDVAVLENFTDSYLISDWAAETLAGMVQAGYVQGKGSEIDPQGTITRQELAQLLCNLSGTVAHGGPVAQEGDVTLLSGDPMPANVTINGNLYLGCDFGEEIVLRGVTVKGRIVLHDGTLKLTGGSRADEIVCCGTDVTVETANSVPVRVSGGNAVVRGGGTVIADAATTLESGRYTSVTVNDAVVTVGEGVTVTEAVLNEQGSRITGSGEVTSAVIRRSGCSVETEGTEVTEAVDAGIGQVQMTAAVPANEATPAAPQISTTVRFNNVDTTSGDGADAGVRYCTLSWYVDGVLKEKTRRFALSEGAEASFSTTASYTGRLRQTSTILARLTYDDETVELSQTVNLHIEKASSPVRTLEVEATVLWDTSLYGYSDLSGWITNVPAGTYAVYTNYVGQQTAKIRLADGTTGWVPWNSIRISSKDYVQYTDYSEVVKENFVNINGYESTTDLLVWISLLTQKVNVFEGTKGDWNLIQTFPCATGKNTTPTIGGVFKYQYRQNYWDFGYYYVNRPMIFNGGHAFHTRTYVKSTGGLLDATMGRPVSQGCVRMYDADVDWLWNNMPFGTTVVVF